MRRDCGSWAWLVRRRPRGDLVNAYKHLKDVRGRCQTLSGDAPATGWGSIAMNTSSTLTWGRTLHEGGKAPEQLPREGVESPSLETSQTYLDTFLPWTGGALRSLPNLWIPWIPAGSHREWGGIDHHGQHSTFPTAHTSPRGFILIFIFWDWAPNVKHRSSHPELHPAWASHRA